MRRFGLLFALVLSLCIPCYAQLMTSPWPGFRHDSTHTGRSDLIGPGSPTLGWSRQIGGGVSSPAVGSGVVYVLGGGNLVAIGLGGELLWSYPCGSGTRSSPAVAASGVVYVACDAWLYAVNSNGTLKWKKALPGTSDASPTVGADGTVYIGCAAGKFQAYTSDGALRYTYSTGRAIASSAAIAPDGTTYFGCDDGCLYALKADGTLKWKFTTSPVGAVQASPTIGPDGSVCFGTSGGFFYCVSSTGVQKFRYGAGVTTSSPAIASDGTIYFGSQDNSLYCLSKVGALRWKFSARRSINSSPAIDSNGVIYVGSNDGSVYAINADGTKAWEYPAGAEVASSPAIGESRSLYVLVADGTLRRLSADSTPPSAPVVIDDGTYSTEQSALHASWSAVDPESGISRYEYAIGTSAGAQDVLAYTDAGTATEISQRGLPLINGQTYYVSVRATNGAGLVGEVGASDGIIVDYTSPSTPIVTDDGQYCSSASSLHASWVSVDSESGVQRYEYAIGTAQGAEDVVRFTAIGTATQVTRTGLTLGDGIRYYISIRATNNAGLVSMFGASDGILVDSTPPQTPIVSDDGQYTTLADRLHFVYGSGDVDSGVEHYEYSVGTTAGLTDVVGWQNAGLVKEQTITGLQLAQGASYYVNVHAYNHAGLSSDGHSNGITVDTTAPASCEIVVLSCSVSEVRFRIDVSDAESGIEQAQYALLASPDASTAQYVDCKPGAEVILYGNFGSAHYIAAQAKNGAGLWNAVTVKQVGGDSTPPTTPVVTDDGVYSTSLSVLTAVWNSQDPETGVVSYSYCLGTTSGLADVVGWSSTTSSGVTLTGLRLVNGVRYFFSVKATNAAGLTSATGSSDGITPETTPPTKPVVTDDGDYTSLVDSLHAAFSSTDAESGVVEFSYCVGTSPGASDVCSWTSAGTASSATVGGLSLKAGVTYYFSAKSRNGVGMWSEVGSSDGIQYRCRESVWPKFHMDSLNTGRSTVGACLSGNVNWRVQTNGYIESSPAFSGDGTSYIGSADGSLYAIGTNGAVRWSYATGGAIDSSPAIGANGEIYVGSCDKNLYCILPNGALSWKFAAAGMIWSSPAIATGGVIYFGCQDGFFYAVKPDGSLKWKYNTGSAVWSSPAIAADGTIYFACGNGKLYALTSAGAFKWAYQSGTAADSSPSVATDGTVYFGSGDGYFYAVNPNGTMRWRSYTGHLVDSTAAIGSDGTVYVGTGGAGYSGTMRAYSSSGVELWRLNLTGGVRSSPALDARGTIYFGTADGKVYALRSDGSAIWTYSAGQSVLSSPAIGPDGQVVVGADDGGIYCFRDYPQDSTPPTKPVVTPAQLFLPKGSPLAFHWSSSDPESGIEGYSYAIGTQPGVCDVANWANAGIMTSASRSDLTLTVGQSYYVSVKASNHVGLVSEIGTSPAIVVLSDNPSNLIGDARQRADGTRVYLPGKTVTAVFADCVFIEEPDRTAGIKCSIASSDLQAGAVVDAMGKIAIQNGEPVLTEVALSRLNVASAIQAVTMTARAATGSGVPTAGLLVRLTGRVTKSGAYYFVISDGSGVDSPRGVKGIEVRAGAGDVPPVGAYVTVTGTLTKDVINGVTTTILRAVPSSCAVILP